MTFGEWLQSMLAERNMSAIDLCRISGIDKSSLSRFLSDENMPNTDNMSRIASGLGLPLIIVFEAAGYAAPTDRQSKDHEELIYLFDQLPDDLKSELLEYLRIRTRRKATA